MLPRLRTRPRWAGNDVYASGDFAGSPTKLRPSDADISDGARGNEQAAAEWENYLRNEQDVLQAALRTLMWGLDSVAGPPTNTVTSITRKDGVALGTVGTNHVLRVFDSVTANPIDSAYAGEGAAGPQFTNAVSPGDAFGGVWLLGGRYTGAPTAGSFGVWLYSPDTPTVAIPLTGANPYAPPTRYLFPCVGSDKCYAFQGTTGTANFAEIDSSAGTWVNRLGGTGMKPATTLGSLIAAGRPIGGVDTLCCVETSTGVVGGAWRVTVMPHDNDSARVINVTANTTIPMGLCWSVADQAFLLLTGDGQVYSLDPLTGAAISIGAPTIGGASALQQGAIAEAGWIGRTSDAKRVLYSADFQTASRMAAPAGTALLFDGEAWWISDGAGVNTYSRTRIAIP